MYDVVVVAVLRCEQVVVVAAGVDSSTKAVVEVVVVGVMVVGVVVVVEGVRGGGEV